MGFYFSNKVDTDKPYYKVDIKSDSGYLAFGSPWKRGDTLYVQADSEKYEETKNKFGESWLDKDSSDYTSTLLDPHKDDKLKEELVLDLSDEPKEEDHKPTPRRGRPKNSSKE